MGTSSAQLGHRIGGWVMVQIGLLNHFGKFTHVSTISVGSAVLFLGLGPGRWVMQLLVSEHLQISGISQ